MDSFETSTGKDRLLELSERIRLDAAVFEHNVARVRDERLELANRRYLEVLRGSLLDEHYLENEVRIRYLLDCALGGRNVSPEQLRDPETFLHKETLRLRDARRVGAPVTGHPGSAYFPFTTMGSVRLDHLDRTLQRIREEEVAGDLVECGTSRGGGAIYMRGFLEAYELSERRVWVADGFRATPMNTSAHPLEDGGVENFRADLNQIRSGFARFGLFDDRVRFLQGGFADTLPDAPIERIALLRIGICSGPEIVTVLEHLYDRVEPDGFVLVEDLSDSACRDALEDFRRSRSLPEPLEQVGASGAAWRKTAYRAEAPAERRRDGRVPAASVLVRRLHHEHRAVRSISQSSWCSTTCVARPPGRCTPSPVPTRRASTTSTTRSSLSRTDPTQTSSSARTSSRASVPSSVTSIWVTTRHLHPPSL